VIFVAILSVILFFLRREILRNKKAKAQ